MASPEISPLLPNDKAKAFAYFQNFIYQLVLKFTDTVGNIIDTPRFFSRLVGGNGSRRSQIETKALEILDLVTRGESFSVPSGSWERSDSKIDSSEIDGSAGIGVSGRIDNRGASGRNEGEVGKSRRKSGSISSERIEVAEGQMILRLASVRKRLIDIIELLNVEYVIITIDEFMSIDPDGNSGIQPEFSELLRRLLFGTLKIGVKIASTWEQTRFFAQAEGHGFRGLEIDADIFQLAHLDWALLSTVPTFILRTAIVQAPEDSRAED